MPWDKLFDNLAKYGIFNSQLHAIAPNSSTGPRMYSTSSFLPTYKKAFIEENALGSFLRTPPFIKDKALIYQETLNIDPIDIVKMAATIQKWTDTGMSLELFFKSTEAPKTIYDSMVYAWKEGCKALYYVRSVKQGVEKKPEAACVGCAN